MKRLVLVVLAVTAAVFSPTAVAATPTSEAGACEEPTLERVYDPDALSMRLAVDLAGCDWWDRSPIQLGAELSRLDGTGEEGVGSFVVCAVHPISDEPDSHDTDASPQSSSCRISVALEHPPAEAARYHGAVTHPWDGGDRTVEFDAVCVAAGASATCRDVESGR